MSVSPRIVNGTDTRVRKRFVTREHGGNGNGMRRLPLTYPSDFTKAGADQSVALLEGPLALAAESGDDNGNGTIIEQVGPGHHFVTRNPLTKEIREEVLRIAHSDLPVLLMGESGTGKEVLALMIHKNSSRFHRPFLKVNCAALPGDLLESELFGHEAGAFTGAVRSKPGRFELCNGGTILLDEIGEMSPFLQAKLLQVLQDGTFSRLGGLANLRVDARVIAATNVNVSRAIAEGRLRQDLYYRLNGFKVSLPPLRERPEDIPVLLRFFLSRYSQAYRRPVVPPSPRILDRLMAHCWPGNIRELENFARRYLILGDEALVLNDFEPKHNELRVPTDSTLQSATGDTVDLKSLARGAKQEVESDAITRALERTDGNRKQAAQLLKISYKALLYKIRRYGIGEQQACKLVAPPEVLV